MKIETVQKQEELLQFTTFTNEDAVNLGLFLYHRAKEQGYPISIHITKNRQEIFHAALPGTSPDSDNWIARKQNTVMHFLISTVQVSLILQKRGITLEDKFKLSEKEYSSAPGGFPITVKEVGVIGALVISGLSKPTDHEFIVESLTDYLKVDLSVIEEENKELI